MAYSFELLERKLDGKVGRVLGSLGGYTLDGRYGRARADDEAMNYYISERHVRPYLIGYRLLNNGVKLRDFIFVPTPEGAGND